MSHKFTQEFKVQAVEKALSLSGNVNLKDIADNLGAGYSTLQRWIAQAKKHELDITNKNHSMTTEKRPQDWSLEQRLNAIIECARLDDIALNQYCREKGLYPHHIQQWKKDFAKAPPAKLPPPENKKLKQDIKQLQKELNRKNKALAETAALLMLKKKADAIWGFNEDD